MPVVIVESFAKAKTIQKYLNEKGATDKYVVIASGGHVCDLVKKNDGVKDYVRFEPMYEMLADKAHLVDNLKRKTRGEYVLFAADNDREGEAIAWHLHRLLAPKRSARIVFNEITRSALQTAIQSPRSIDEHLVEAQQSRRVLDRIIGFCMTKVLWKRFDSSVTLSAGRVQSVVLDTVVKREEDIDRHKTTPYWTLNASISSTSDENDAQLYESERVYRAEALSTVHAILKSLQPRYYVDEARSEISKVRESAPDPLTTSALQQRCGSIGMSAAQTMKFAQELYEAGHITYMRTDSREISEEAKKSIRAYVTRSYGEQFLATTQAKQGKKASKHEQGAHEAIRPTRFEGRDSSKIPSGKPRALYELIYDVTVASQMTHAVYDEARLFIRNDGLSASQYFLGKKRMLREPGWRAVFGGKPERAPTLLKGNVPISTIHARCVWTSPPSRYTEPAMVKFMEREGIGRPSTYVSIMQKLYERTYVEKADVQGEQREYVHIEYDTKRKRATETKEKRPYYSERGCLVPTDTGKTIASYLRESFKELMTITFTADMETRLDDVANGNRRYVDVMKTFYPSFAQRCARLQEKNEQKMTVDNTNSRAMKDGRIVRVGRYGPLIETPRKGEKSVFHSLKPYLAATRKTLKDIDDADVQLIVSMPRRVNKLTVEYGRYGFYVRDEEKQTRKIYPKFIANMLQNDYEFLSASPSTKRGNAVETANNRRR